MPYNICFLPILLDLQAASFAAVDKTIENRFIRNRFKRGKTKRSQTAAVYERFPSTVFLRTRYALGASTGQTLAQAPQSMQVSGSITYLPSSLTLMAPTGHSPSQVPQPMQVLRGAGVALAARAMWERGECVPPAALLPDYHRLSQAERERAEREKTEGKQNEV